MNTIRKSILIGLAALSMGAASIGVYAEEGRHGHAATADAQQRQDWQAKRAEHAAKRLAKLHDELKITAQQEPAWSAFAASMTPAPRNPGARAEHAEMAKLPAPERAERMLAKHKEHLAKMEEKLAALKTFYAALTPEQQQTFDARAKRMHGGMHGGGHHRMMMRHHG